MEGSECVLTGLPLTSGPTETSLPALTTAGSENFFVQSKFDNTYGDSSGIAVAGLMNFLNMDFSPAGPYPAAYSAIPQYYGDPDAAGNWTVIDPPVSTVVPRLKGPAYGPSSAHPAVINAGLGDGSVQSLSKRIDSGNLFFLITKNNNDPFYLP
jgi:hypothetical protein